jgi:hypothetical protein
VICDNVIIHRSKIVGRWLRKHPRLRVLHGARYSPHDNPVERMGRTQGIPSQQPDPDHRRPRPPGARLLPRPQRHAELTTAPPHSSPWLPESYVQHFRQAA